MKPSLPYENATPESQGLSSQAIIDFVHAIKEAGLELHGMIISRHHKILAEGYWAPYSAKPHRIYSANKCTNMLQTLFAIQEGYFNLDDRMADLMPDKMPDPLPDKLSRLTLRHLLMMATGHDKDTFGAILQGGVDRAKAFFICPLVYEPGTHFLYNNGVPDMLALLCRRYTKMTMLEYLKPRLFDPLDIQSFSAHMNGDEPELPTASMALRDLFKMAMLLNDHGMWQGKQLIDPQLIDQAGLPQISNLSHGGTEQQTAGYGWQLWRNAFGGFRIDGGGGQFGIIAPEHDMVVALNSHEFRAPQEITILWEQTIKKCSGIPLKEDPEKLAELQQVLREMTTAEEDTGIRGDIKGTYTLEEPLMNASSVAIDLNDGEYALSVPGEELVYFTADGAWKPCMMPFSVRETEKPGPSFRLPPCVAGADPKKAYVSAVFTTENELELQFRSDAWDGGYYITLTKSGQKLKAVCEGSQERNRRFSGR